MEPVTASASAAVVDGHDDTPTLQVELISLHAVAKWTWDVTDDCCGICRMSFDAFCTDCKLPGDDCPPVCGVCTHVFHMHCILKWVNTKDNAEQQCPMCRR